MEGADRVSGVPLLEGAGGGLRVFGLLVPLAGSVPVLGRRAFELLAWATRVFAGVVEARGAVWVF